ncbi:hypothetical protein NQ176_g5632 [Zarea fungicola]|uniref:Uncharacterized protein n=1 Tax=Zarea fungicola TaxID=93591 RepID=A0ACC1N8W2_9HYPO|nr:hypothetical protein NQ176_g5632 [Lecanicillium fungicola]
MPFALEERVGPCNSPTVLVDGFDVTGEPREEDGRAACRLDLPNEEQISAAIRVLSTTKFEQSTAPGTLAAAFQVLLQTREPLSIEALSSAKGWEAADVQKSVVALQRDGLVHLDADGYIVGVCGLSVTPTNHEMHIQGRIYWAWCALDVIGIFGALRVSGLARSLDPLTRCAIKLEFENGLPKETNLLICMADHVPGLSIKETWCCNVNFFKLRSAGQAWMSENGVTGSIFVVENVTAAAREACLRLGVRESWIRF